MAARKVQDLASVVGSNISRRRKELGMTQANLAEQLGMGPDSLSRIEKGIVAPRFQRLADTAKALDCAVADLFRMESDPVGVKIGALADLLRPLPPEAQDDIINSMVNLLRAVKKW